MDDDELLARAAKAAGIDLDSPDQDWWNPLTDSGDALDLAVKLRIEPKWPFTGEAWAVRGETLIIEDGGNDILGATRRAIVMVAAELAPKD